MRVAVSELSSNPRMKVILPRSMCWWCVANHWGLIFYHGSASWKWSEDHAPEILHKEVSEYSIAAEIRNEYMQEFHTWIGNGWLVPYPEDKLGPPKGLIPLMVVLQQSKN